MLEDTLENLQEVKINNSEDIEKKVANTIFLIQCKWAWKDGSKVEISLCFFSGPGFNTYHCILGPPVHSQPPVLPVPGDPKSSSGICRCHIQTKHSHT